VLKAKISSCPNKRMEGRELRRLRVAAGLSERKLAEKFDTYQRQIQRFEKVQYFELPPKRMHDLLTALSATSI